MALFAQSDDWIKARLRLSSVPTNSVDTQAIVADSILNARLEIHRRVGRAVVNRILATAEVANPSSDDEVRRSVASRLELNLVTVDLYRRLPNSFMDASGDLNRRWNEEAPFRERPRSDREREIQRLLDQIEEDAQLLVATEDVPGNAPGVLTFLSTPAEAPPRPGDTILFPPTVVPTQD